MSEERLSFIYSGSIVQADLLKCLVEGQGIETFLHDETVGTLFPWYRSTGGAGAVKVLVANSNIDKARPFVDDFLKNNR